MTIQRTEEQLYKHWIWNFWMLIKFCLYNLSFMNYGFVAKWAIRSWVLEQFCCKFCPTFFVRIQLDKMSLHESLRIFKLMFIQCTGFKQFICDRLVLTSVYSRSDQEIQSFHIKLLPRDMSCWYAKSTPFACWVKLSP